MRLSTPPRSGSVNVVMAGLIIFALLVLGGSFSLSILGGSSSNAIGPRLIVPKSRLELKGCPNEVMKVVFPIENTGDERLVFSITASCGCTKLEPEKSAIEAGERRRIHVELRLGRHPGVRQGIQLQIRSNDESRPSIRYAIAAKTRVPFTVEPAMINFGNVRQGKSRSIQIRIRPRAGGEPIDPAHISWGSRSPALTITQGSTDSSRSLLDVSIKGDTSRGPVSTSIELKVRGLGQFSVPVYARVVGEFDVIPAKVFLIRKADSNAIRPVVLHIRRFNGRLLPAVRQIGSPDGFQIKLSRHEDGKRLQLSISGTVGQSALEPDEIQIRFVGIDAPLCIPVRLLKMNREKNPATPKTR